jgi:hypothetical protein
MAIDPSKILLTGRVAVITGGGAGIGRGIAEGMAAFGASVAIWERDPDTCAALRKALGRWVSQPMSAIASKSTPRLNAPQARSVKCRFWSTTPGVCSTRRCSTLPRTAGTLCTKQPAPCVAVHAAGGPAPRGRRPAGERHQRDVDRGYARGAGLRGIRGRQGGRDQLHQDRGS